MRKKDLMCPLILFQQHLTSAIRKWRAAGERIVLFMDHNEHVYDGALGKALSHKEGLNLNKAILQHRGARIGAAFFRGSKPINCLWVSSDLDISNACIIPFGYRVGDYPAFILDIPLESLVGLHPIEIVRLASCRLNSQLPWCCNEYIRSLESNIIQYCLLEHLHDAYTGHFTSEERAQRVIAIDEEGKHTCDMPRRSVRRLNLAESLFPPMPPFEENAFRCIICYYNTTKGE
jgi:hypothetical protein